LSDDLPGILQGKARLGGPGFQSELDISLVFQTSEQSSCSAVLIRWMKPLVLRKAKVYCNIEIDSRKPSKENPLVQS